MVTGLVMTHESIFGSYVVTLFEPPPHVPTSPLHRHS